MDPAADLSAIVTDRDLIKTAAQLPPPFKPDADAVAGITALTLAIKTQPEISIVGVAETADAATAKKVADYLHQLQTIARQLVPRVRQMLAASPPESRSAARFAAAKLDNLVAGLAPRQAGNRVTIEIRGLGTVTELASQLVIPELRRALKNAKEQRILVEISMMDSAFKAYRTKYGEYPPSDFSDLSNQGPVAHHLAKAFPHCNVATEIAAIGGHLSPAQALVFWLRGPSADPEHPISGPRGRTMAAPCSYST